MKVLPDSVNALADFPLTQGISAKSLSRIIDASTVIDYERDEVLAEIHQRLKSVYFVLRGTIGVFIHDHEGQQVLIKLLTAPAFFGEHEALYGTPSDEVFVAAEDTRVVSLPADAFRKILDDEPLFTKRVLADAVHRFRIAYVNTSRFLFDTVEQRLASVLLAYADAMGTRLANGRVQFNRRGLGYEKLGAHISATSKSIQRTVQSWDEKGLLKRDPGLWSLDVEALQAHVGSDLPDLAHRIQLPEGLG